jgi:polysaccharide export outer membrane protein
MIINPRNICQYQKIDLILHVNIKIDRMTAVKKTCLPIVALVVMIFLNSCSSSKNVAYFQNSDFVSLDSSKVLYDARIMPKDLITITVSTTDQDAAIPFNLTVPNVMTQNNRSTYSQPVIQNYLVDNEGNVDFPVVGSLHLGGLTKSQAEKYIHDKIIPYMSKNENPIVCVRMTNFKVSVLGEVQSPKTLVVSNEKINILEALAEAGDLTIYGKRDNVKLIREDALGQKHIYKLNLNDAGLINSPYFYLQQNDVLYVEPNKAKSQNSDISNMTSLWFSATSILVSVASLLVTIFR